MTDLIIALLCVMYLLILGITLSSIKDYCNTVKKYKRNRNFRNIFHEPYGVLIQHLLSCVTITLLLGTLWFFKDYGELSILFIMQSLGM